MRKHSKLFAVLAFGATLLLASCHFTEIPTTEPTTPKPTEVPPTTNPTQPNPTVPTTGPVNEHEYVWVDEVPATCDENGVKGHYTRDDGKYFDAEYNEITDLVIPALGHEFDLEIVWDGDIPTSFKLVCSNDPSHEITKEELLTKGTIAISRNVLLDPTCDAVGYVNFRIDITYNGKQYYAVSDQIEVPKLEHVWKWVVDKEPTETEDGIQHEECEICGEKRNENTIIPHIHTHEFSPVEAVAPTCEAAGHKEYYTCSVCEHSYEDKDGTKLIPNLEAWLAEGGDGYVAPLGHDYELVVEWNGLDSTYSLVCKNDRTHVIAQADLEGSVVADEGQYVPATCEEEGEICYIVNVTYNGKSYRAVSELITLPKLAHEFTLIPALDPTPVEAGHKEYYLCSLCGKAFASKNEESLIEDLEVWLAEGGEGYLAPKGLVDTKTTTYTFTNKEFADATNSWKAIEAGNNFEKNNDERGVQASGKANLKVESVGQYNGVVEVLVVASSNEEAGVEIFVSVGDVTLGQKITKGNNQDVAFEFEMVDGVITVETKNNAKSVWIKSIQVEYSKAVTPEHEHEYTYSVVWKEEKAYLVAACSKCEEGTEGHEVKTELQVSEAVTPATCEVAGSRVLTATLPEGVENNNYELVKTIVIPAKGHDYDLDGMTWSWANDNSETKLLIACKDCDHVEVIEGVITKSVVTDEVNNLIITTLTAKATFKGVEYTDVKTISVPAHTHVFEFGGFRWNEDKTKAYAIERCNVDDCTEERLTEVEAVKNDVKSAEFAATCEQAGKDIYDVTFDGHNGELEKVTDALGHSVGEEIAEVPATCDKEGVKAHYECSICHELFVKNEQGEFVKVTAEELAIAKLPHGTLVEVESKIEFVPSTFTKKGTSSTGSLVLGQKDDVTIKSDKGYVKDDIRSYAHSVFEITSEKYNIKSIKFTFADKSKTGGLNAEIKDVNSKKWSVSLDSQARFAKIVVELDVESGAIYELEHVAAKESTCLEQGNIEYWYCPNCGAKFADAEGKTEITDVLLPLAPHQFGEPTYKWEDGKCTATRECTVCGHVETETVEGVYTLVSAATCTQNEKYKLVATFENSTFEQQESKVFEKENSALGHDFAEPTYAWNGDECIATRVCKRDENHVETETVKGVYTLVSAATCTENEKYKLVATFENSAFEQQESEVFEKENTAFGHEYMVLWGWAEDYSFATATFTCMNDATHTAELNATIEKEKVDATCTTTGLISYTATVELDGDKYTDEKYVEIPMAEHELELNATWDNGVATYELGCKNCNYVVDQSEYTSKVIHTDDTATCHATGEITYTLVVTYAGKEYTSSSTVTTPMLEHNWVWVIDKEPTNDEDGIKHEECTLCGEKRNEGTPIHKLHDHVMKLVEQVEPTCEVAGHKAYYQCTECKQYYEDEEAKLLIEDLEAWISEDGKGYIAPLGHDYEITYTWADDNSTVTAKAVCKHDSTHVVEETVETVVETIVPECEGGLADYTATFTNELFEEQTKEVVIPALGHDHVFKDIQLVEGKFVEVLVCSRCGDVKYVEATNVVASVAKDDVVYGFTTLKDAYDFAEENATIVLVSDVALNEQFVITKAITLDLNGHTINSIIDKDHDAFVVHSKLTIKNGSIVRKLETPVHAKNIFVVYADGELHVDDLTVDSNISTFVLANLGSVVEILNSTIKSETYAVSTNASGVAPYGAPEQIIIKDSRLEVYPYAGEIGDCATLLINTPTKVSVEGSTLIGGRQVVINRCGTITIKDSTLNNTCDFPDATKYLDKNWRSGNEVPTAYLVVGNRTEKAYEYPANCTLDNVDFVGETTFPYIYTYGNTEVNNATLTITNDIKINGVASELTSVSFNGYTTLVIGELSIYYPLTYVEATDSTCEIAGNIAYYLCDKTGDKFEDKDGLVKLENVEKDLLEHTYSEVTYVWNNDECTATRVCLVCGHVETETVKAVNTVVTAATCETTGTYKYVATFKNKAFVQQVTEELVSPALDHDWKTATKLDYHFENGKLVVLEKECSRCGEKVYVDAELVDATAAASETYSGKEIFVIGKVSSKSSHSNPNIYLNNGVLELYKPASHKFTVNVGDAVIGYGNVKKFSNQWELDEKCSILAVLKFVAEGDAKAHYTLTDNGTTYYYDSEFKFIGDETAFTAWSSEGGEGYIVKHTVTFNSMGGSEVVAVKVNEGGKISKPSNPTKEGYKFVGWFTSSDNGTTLSETAFDFENVAITTDITLYAKWEEGTTSESVTVKYSVTKKNTVTASTSVEGVTAALNETYSTSKQMTSGNSMTLTISGLAGKKLTGLTLSMRSNASKGAGKLLINGTYVIGDEKNGIKFNNSKWNGAWSTSYVDINVSLNTPISADDNGNLIIVISATENSLYCESFTLTIE